MTASHARRRRGALIKGVLAITMTLLLASCHLDVTATVTMNTDGTGEIVVEATADTDLVDAAGGADQLASALDLSDAAAAAWVIDGPTPNAEGGMDIRLSHTFHDADEAMLLLNTLGGPFAGLELRRDVEGTESDAIATTSLWGTATLGDAGFRAFADQQLLDAVGGLPFEPELAATTPDASLDLELAVVLPGDVLDANTEQIEGMYRWNLPVDGSATEVQLRAQQTPDQAPGWARPAATLALVALVGWIVLSVCFVVFVVQRRRRLATRRRH